MPLKEWPNTDLGCNHQSIYKPHCPSYNLHVQLFWYQYILIVVEDLWCSAVAGIGELLVDEDCCEGGLSYIELYCEYDSVHEDACGCCRWPCGNIITNEVVKYACS